MALSVTWLLAGPTTDAITVVVDFTNSILAALEPVSNLSKSTAVKMVVFCYGTVCHNRHRELCRHPFTVCVQPGSRAPCG